jgi:hypothetical protein
MNEKMLDFKESSMHMNFALKSLRSRLVNFSKSLDDLIIEIERPFDIREKGVLYNNLEEK